MSSEAVIRAARADELAAVLSLWQESDVTPPSVTDSIDGLTRLMREPGGILFVAIVDGRIVGSVIGGWDGWRGNIYRLAVTPEYRRRGIARRLVLEISSALFAKGAERLSALVEHEHRWAIDFWESLRDLGYEYNPWFARYIADRGNGTAPSNLARILDNESRPDDERTMLPDIYNWFTEGFDIADLKDAKALIDQRIA